MDFKQKTTVLRQRLMGFLQDQSGVSSVKDIELAKDEHHQAVSLTIVCRSNILLKVGTLQLFHLSKFTCMGYRGRGEINPYTCMPQLSEPTGIQPWATAQIKDFCGPVG